MRFSFIWVFGELFSRIQGVGMSCYAYWTIGGFMSMWANKWWVYDIITSYGVEIGEWIGDDVWYWFEWS